ncbi:MAG: 50S ribosomal protein L18 [Candidatus Neomarinimicrobiota bacterium]|nr:50S ribosomal protein L18 [Candidatus Neomarinimicrobiota bacterium]MEC8706491.1 50S ribosomal protein L18 [Candidatus Neomarinimicrobiota bacterium]|tara:strand:- start:939 stop:1313 length:375 start_codon:yes stop_codon:yes gene_type:complete
MIRNLTKKEIRNLRRTNRSKAKNVAHPTRLRLVVSKSLKNITAQIVDDHNQSTLVSSSSLDKNLQKDLKKAITKKDISTVVGESIAIKAKKKKITEVVFDRNGNPYHGRIKALAEAARKAGLKF